MKHGMATRNPAQVNINRDCTEFQMHKTQYSHFDKKLIDFTEHRLMHYMSTIADEQQRSVLLKVISDYCKGLIAVAWKKGRPIYLNLTKDK